MYRCIQLRRFSRHSMSEIIPEYYELPSIPVEEVLAIQSLAMSTVRERARRVRVQDSIHRFVIYDSSAGPIGSNGLDTFLSVSVGKKDFRWWQMSVSFLSLLMNHKLRYSNTRELYRFDWDAEGHCSGIKFFYDNHNPVIETLPSLTDDKKVVDIIQPRAMMWSRPVDANECDELCDRMLQIITR